MTQQHPLIGITGNFGEKGCELAQGYYLSVLKTGGTPIVIPPHNDQKALLSLLNDLDGIVFSGGGDINPLLLGEEPLPQLRSVCPQRDEAELFLAREAFHRQIPMLGICRGIQVMAAALGGKVYQDIYAQQPPSDSPLKGENKKSPFKGDLEGLLKHSQDMPREFASHTVSIEKGSLLYSIFGKEELAVNSFHHQAVSEAGPHLRVSAVSPDGIIEAVESSDINPCCWNARR